ncbi:cobalamin biosynthesis protein CbiG [Silvimonas terrae]|uniref:Cobalamin biosynthesis protein CbiG n=1 Tax=Silvimonas terrae TaxID=300266 RepID=A0A840RF02_9NEIS|nr:cobalamin biosynthesis protein [Silvimonas terrae]MBB5190970.1 cobalamin biosynthesis protein CbiG [Silvimonas terrae]
MTPQLALGIGCRQNSTAAEITAAVTAALGERRLAEVRRVATIAARANAPGLSTFCQQQALPLQTFSAAEINALPQSWPPSAFVMAQLGVTGVCEPCALLAAAGGPLLVSKFILDGVTVAIAAFQDLSNEN